LSASREIAAGVAAIGEPVGIPVDVGERAQRLRGELIAATGTARHGTDDAREAALRREIAATGLRGLPARVIDDLLPQLEAAGRGGSGFGVVAALIALCAVAAGFGFAHAHLVGIAFGVAGAGVAEAAGLARVVPIGAITHRRAGEELAPYHLLADAGCVAFSEACPVVSLVQSL